MIFKPQSLKHQNARISGSTLWATRSQPFAQSEMVRTKTDGIDAALIARFCRLHQPEPWTPPAAEIRILQGLVRREHSLIEMRVEDETRRGAPDNFADGHGFDRGDDRTPRERNPTCRERDQDVARLVKRLTFAASIEATLLHTVCATGSITSAAATKGISEADIQRVPGHRSVAILRGYVRRANVFDEAPLTAILSR
jgi:transposase